MGDQPTDYSSIDSFHVGRRRKPNFTDHEVLNIVDQYDTYKELLHSREASKTVIAQKQAIWKQITDNLNATYPQVERTVEDVRRKWKKLQSEAKREAAAYRTALQAGTTTSISSKQINLYNRILNICRPSTVPGGNASGTPFNHSAAFAAAAALHHQQQQQHHHHHHQQQISHSSINDVDQSSEKADSPSSDLAVGGGESNQLDSPAEESPSLLGHDENSSSPKTTTMPSTSVSSSVQLGQTSSMNNGQISRRTLDKRRKAFKSNAYANATPYNPRNYVQQQNSLRYESLLKRKRTLELTSQRLSGDKERLLIERKNLDLKLAATECEHERCTIDKRRIELALQKYQSEQSATNHHDVQQQQAQHLSDHEDVLEDNPSYDEMSDINE